MKEFELIKKYFTRDYHRPDIILGIGDDAAIVAPPAGQLVLTLDTLVAGVHFPLDTSPFDIGYKTAAVNLSDLAAMGAKPLWATLALTLPDANESWLVEFSRGLFTMLDHYQVALIGGDTTRGPLTITLQAHGSVPTGKGLRRDAAQAEDLIYVSGTLGDAGLALQNIKDKFILSRLNQPTPRIELGLAALDLAHACIDISDGFAQDLQHILSASKVGAEINLENLPLSTEMKKHADLNRAYKLALTSGDDYELCLTVPPQNQPAFETAAKAINCPISCVGKITQQLGLNIYAKGNLIDWKLAGYEHF